ASSAPPAPMASAAPIAPPAPAEAAAAPSPPDTPESPEAARKREDALRAQMDGARRRLEVAAQQLAALSAQMNGPMMRRFEDLASPPRILVGLQLDGLSGNAGARVREVSPGGPAEQAGVRPGDLIMAVNGTSVRGQQPAAHVVELLHDVKPGDKVDLKVSRNGKMRELTVTARPDEGYFFTTRQFPDLPPLPRMKTYTAWGGGPMVIGGPVADMELARLTPGLGRYFGTDSGVLVVRAPTDGGLGLQDGDVILSIDGRKPIDSSHVIRILGSYDPGEKLTLDVLRLHRRISVVTAVPAQPPMGVVIRQPGLLGPGPVITFSGKDPRP
ncbi:MAG: PDZ domain-containing protein, partial [Steroidobacteraceae bacterium]